MNKFNSSYDLYMYLDKKYDTNAKLDPLAALRGSVQGVINGEIVSITFQPGDYLLLTGIGENTKVIDLLMDDMKLAMNGSEPIIRYNMNHVNEGQDIIKPTVEWDISNPEKRIKEVINGRAFPDKPVITDIKLYNGKSVESYLETEEEKLDRIKNARIYGIDPGSIKDVNSVASLSEVDLFFQIHGLGGHIWRCKHDMSHGRIPVIDLTEEQYALEYLVYQTTKFGVDIPEPEIDKHIAKTPSYTAWYNFYANHFNNVLTDNDWKEFVALRSSGQDVSMFMPKGNWRDLLVDPVKKELK